MQIEKLDRTQPPPGYEIRDTSYEDGDDEVGGYGVNISEWSWIADGYTDSASSRNACVADAWRNYEEDNDPPGMETWNEAEGPPGGVWMVGVLGESGHFGNYRSEIEARADAWSHYWRRVVFINAWPRCLAWSDEQVASVNNEPGSED